MDIKREKVKHYERTKMDGRRVTDSGDDVAIMLRAAATDDDLRKIAKKHGLLDKWDGWAHLNRGQRRMCLGNAIRAQNRKEAAAAAAAAE